MKLEKHIKLNNKYSIFSIHGSNATNSNIFDHYNIQGVPTIRYMNKKGVIDDYDYSGNREVLDIMNYLKLRGNDDKSKPKPKPKLKSKPKSKPKPKPKPKSKPKSKLKS